MNSYACSCYGLIFNKEVEITYVYALISCIISFRVCLVCQTAGMSSLTTIIVHRHLLSSSNRSSHFAATFCSRSPTITRCHTAWSNRPGHLDTLVAAFLALTVAAGQRTRLRWKYKSGGKAEWKHGRWQSSRSPASVNAIHLLFDCCRIWKWSCKINICD